MNAYVLDAAPIHENSINYFAATLGFYRIGYYVERYRLSEIPKLELCSDTPVFGGVESIMQVFPNYVSIPHYPDELRDYLGREIVVKPIREVQAGEFFKPLEPDHKLFRPQVMDDSLAAGLAAQSVPPERPVYVTKGLKILGEFRCYVLRGEILAVHGYKGDCLAFPKGEVISGMVERFKSAPVAYGLDVGVLDDGRTVLIEVNDFCCLGNYGIRPAPYAAAIAARWEQLWGEYGDGRVKE